MSSYRRLPDRADDEAIKGLARAFVEGRVYHDGNVDPQSLSMVFMPLLFGDVFKGYRKEQLSSLAIFAVRGEDHAMDMAVNGYPIFTACHIWRRSDVRKAYDLAERMAAALEEIQP